LKKRLHICIKINQFPCKEYLLIATSCQAWKRTTDWMRAFEQLDRLIGDNDPVNDAATDVQCDAMDTGFKPGSYRLQSCLRTNNGKVHSKKTCG